MKRIFLPAAAPVLLALLLGGCTMDGGRIDVTEPPMVTSNVTSSPAPVTSTPAAVTPTRAPETPAVTPEGPGAGSKPDTGSGLTSGNGIDQGSGANSSSHRVTPSPSGN